MAKSRNYLFNGGGTNDAVWCAPKGTTFPVDLSAPPAAWKDLGWLGEDGMDFDSNIDRKEFRAHQGGTIVKRKITGSGRTVQVVAEESNLVVLGLQEPGITWTKTGTGASAIATGLIPEVIATTELAWIIDMYDESYAPAWHRRRMFTGEASPRAAYKVGVEDMTVYAFEIAIYGSPIEITNNPSLIAALP